MTRSQVQLITVSYFSADRLAGMLDSLENSTTPIDSLVVADNAADDLELAELGRKYPRVDVLDSGGNLGYGGAVNAAVRARPSDSEWILVSNPDLAYTDTTIEELVRAGEDPSVGVVGPLILTPIGEVYPSARNLPSLRTGVGHALFSRVWRRNPWTLSYTSDREHPPRERDAGWVSGSCMLIRRSAFDATGGFDERFFMYFEDVDLCARIGRAGWRIRYAPSAQVVHEGGHATQTVNREMVLAHHRSAYTYLSSRYVGWYLWPLRMALRAGLAVRGRIARS